MRVSGSRVEGRPLGGVAEGIHCELTFHANRGLLNNGLQTDEALPPFVGQFLAAEQDMKSPI